MQLFAGELTNQNREYYKVNDNHFIGYANNTCDITLHNDFWESFIYLKVIKLLHINEET